MKRSLLLMFFVLIHVLGEAQRLNTAPPKKSNTTFRNPSAISYIFVPIRIGMGELSALIQENLPNKYSGSIPDIKEGRYTVHLGNLNPKIRHDQLSYNIDYLNGIASGVLGITVSGRTAGVSANINSLSGAINLYPNLSLDNYRLKTKLKMDNHVDHAEMQACKYIGWPVNKNMCSISVPVTGMVDESIEKQINQSRSRIENSIQSELDKLNLEKTASIIWKGFYSDARLDTTSSSPWLISRPKRVFLGELSFTEDYAEFGVGLNLATRIDSTVPPKSVKKKLPEPISTSRKDGYYQCTVPSYISYDYLEEYINRKYHDYVINYQGKRFMKLKEVRIYGSQKNELIVGFRVDGVAKKVKRARGWIYVRAEIELVENDYTLKVKSYDVDAETNNVLLNYGLEVMANKTHYKKVLSDLQFDLKPQLMNYQKQIDAYLKKGYKNEFGTIKGSLSEMDLHGFHMGASGITVTTKLMGELNPFYIDLTRRY